MKPIMTVILAAVVTYLLGSHIGWIAVPVSALIMSVGARELKMHAWQAGLGAALAWSVGLIQVSRESAFQEFMKSLGAVFRVPGPAMIFIALVLAFGLAWSVFVLMSIIRPRADA